LIVGESSGDLSLLTSNRIKQAARLPGVAATVTSACLQAAWMILPLGKPPIVADARISHLTLWPGVVLLVWGEFQRIRFALRGTVLEIRGPIQSWRGAARGS
jgi:hypothetical protein